MRKCGYSSKEFKAIDRGNNDEVSLFFNSKKIDKKKLKISEETYRLVMHEKKIKKNADLFREAGYVLGKRDEMAISLLEKQSLHKKNLDSSR